MSDRLQPLQDRLIALDVLRGFALFGVLLVNMLDFSGSGLRLGTLGSRGSELDQLLDLAIAFFALTKFYLLFSWLFGVGFAVQMRRMETSGRPFVAFYLRRLLVLFVIGILHAILIWDGDILRLYAVAGGLLLLVRHLETRYLLALAVLIAGLACVFFSLSPSIVTNSEMLNQDVIQLYLSGSYGDLVAYRASQQFVLDIQVPMVLVMFLLGLTVGRSGVLDEPQQYQSFLRRWWKWALVVGLVGNALLLWGYEAQVSWMVSIGIHIGAPALAFVYVSAVLLNVERLRALAPLGQMALTNYLTHSIVFTTLFYAYGLAWYDQLAPTLTVVLVLVMFAAQIILSQWWMARYRYGLMEWLWRSLTYGQMQAMRRTSPTR